MVSIRQLWVVVFLFALSACGGGGTLDNSGGNNNGGGNTPVYTLSLTIKNGQGQNTNQLSLASPLVVEATLSATNNGLIAGRLINFTFDTPGLASFGNDTGSAATNANGIASIGINVGTLSGAGKITASFGDITAEVVFISAGDGDTEVGVQIGSVLLIADKLQLGSADTDQIELSALVRNTSNNVVSGVPVVFSTDSGELQILDTESAANGIARATLTTRSDKNNREIRVVARAQQQVSELLISVVGTQIDIASPQAVVLNDSALIDIFVQDSEGKGIEGVVVNITSSLGNTLSMTNPITSGASGKAAVTYTAVNSGVDTLLVTALGSQRSATLNVSPDSFTFLPTIANPPPVEEVELNTPKRLLLQWLVDDLPNATQMVNFATSRGVIAESAAELGMNKVSVVKQTDATGQADVFVQSRFAGLATIAAQAGTGEGTVNAQKTVEFIAVTPAKIEVQAFPAQVGPGEQSTVRAILRDALNNPVKNKTVIFSLDNAAGGQLGAVSAITNSLGVATTLFTADVNTGSGAIPTCETDDTVCECTNDDKTDCGLKITATYVSSDGENTVGFTRVAVGERTLFFRFGTGNAIEKPSNSLYSKEFSIIVTDSSGNPVPNQQLNVAVVPISYTKGVWVPSLPPPGEFKLWVPDPTITCPNEDVNLDGILEPSEDTNGDGQITPGNLATVTQTVTADADGIAVFNVRYPQDVGAWLDVRLQVSGFASGTENIAFREYSLPVSSEDVTNETSPPPENPFGFSLVCTDNK